MAGYGPKMVMTPWGNAADLHGRRLRPGPGTSAEEVERNQRERLYAATVAAVADKGYEAMTVADLLALSGVSRSAFYRHFRDKEDCFLATFETIAALGMELVSHQFGRAASWDERARRALNGVFTTIARQPAAARLCFIEVGVAGPRAIAAAEEALAGFAALAGKAIGGLPGKRTLPAELVRALLGGVRTIVRSRLHGSEAQALPALAPQLWEWAKGYEPPPAPLRLGRRWAPARQTGMPPLAAYSPGERIIRALAAASAERGYAAVTNAEIATRASVSTATFNAHFASKEEALMAALDSSVTQMLAVAMPAIRRAPDWANGVRAGIGGFCAFGATEPDLASLAAAGIYASSPQALSRREQTMTRLSALLAPGYELAPEVPEIAAEAIVGAVLALAYERIASHGPETLPEVAPLATYVALAPFLGAEAACEVANGNGLGPAVAQQPRGGKGPRPERAGGK